MTRPPWLSAFSSLTRMGSPFKAGPEITARAAKKAKNCAAGDHGKRFEATRKMLHSHSTERRRTARVSLAVPVTVAGQTEMNEKFCLKTSTLSVSAFGGLIGLDLPVVVGQKLALINGYEQREYECTIVSVTRGGDKKQHVGFEFMDPACNFWHMTFTAPGARPLRRVTPIRISA